MTFQFRKIGTAATFSLLTLFCSHNAFAAPGLLPSVPLFNTNLGVEPNVFFTVDDSGSMDWEISFSKGSTSFETDQGLPIINGNRREYLIPDWESDLVPTLKEEPDTWIFRNSTANTLYYNPVLDYKPWKGKKADGTDLYGDADPENVREHPDDTTGKLKITSEVLKRYLPTFCTWDADPNNNGIDETDDHTCVEIKAGNEHLFPSGNSLALELINFANWMQYYRKREYAAKQAIGSVIQATDAARMGMRFINSSTTKDLKTMTDDLNKSQLLTTYYADNASGGTPLRQALKKTGEMFKSPGAILPQVDGGECQQNFNVLMTDGYWNGSTPSGIGNTDGDNDSDFDGSKSSTPNIDKGNYADSQYDTLADVAMYYYENDLSGLDDKVPTTAGVDLNKQQHLVNYTIAFGLQGTLKADASPLDIGFTWPVVTKDEDTTLDDLRHAAYNSRGLFLSAGNSQVLLDALLTAVIDITDRSTTAAAASVTSAKLTTDTIVFLAEYNTIKWQGDILAHKIKTDSNNKVLSTGELEELPVWSAAEKLNDLDYTTRTILTYDKTTLKDGVPFKWDNLTTPMINDLKTSCATTTTIINPPAGNCIQLFNKTYCPVTKNYYRNTCPKDDRERLDGVRYCYDPDASTGTTTSSNSCTTDTDSVTAKARLEYIRGDRSNEAVAPLDFRERVSPLGDIVNAGPVYAGTPNLNIPDGAPFPTGDSAYSKFKEANNSRTGVVYAGSNDGMMHAFRESDGEEMLAYIPSYLFSADDKKGLHYLTEKKYNHMFYNDLTATVADVYINSGGGTGWRTILIGGQRGGGRGYYALDVTNPDSFHEDISDEIVMWEFSSDNDADLGFTYSRPQIGLMNDGNWVAIFGNGYNSTGDGEAKLFIVKLEGGTDGVWTLGTDYYTITTGSGSTSTTNGLATPALADIDGNGTIDRAYAGDLNGDLWAFDISGASFGSGTLAYSTPLFTTEGSLPITSKPILSFHPTEPNEDDNAPNLMVFFGSGQFLVDEDKKTANNDYFYGVWDRGTPGLSRAKLVEQTFVSDSPRILTQNPVNYSDASTREYGWNIHLDIAGERSITNSAVRGDIVLFNSSIPLATPCSSGGYGYRFAVDIATGGTPSEPVLDYDKNGVIDSNDTIGDDQVVPSADKLSTLPTDNTFTDKVGYTGKDPFAIAELKDPHTGRFSWQELLK